MITEVKAWKDRAGKIYESELDALEQDVRLELEDCLADYDQQATVIEDILQKALGVHAILAPLVKYLDSQPKAERAR